MKDKSFNSIIISAVIISVYSFLVKNGYASDRFSFIIYAAVGLYFVLSIYSYFKKSDSSIDSVKTKSDSNTELMNKINASSNEIETDVESDYHEIEVDKREKAKDEGKKFSIESINDIKDDKVDLPASLEKKLAFKSTSIADIDFDNVEVKALEELADFEKSLEDKEK